MGCYSRILSQAYMEVCNSYKFSLFHKFLRNALMLLYSDGIREHYEDIQDSKKITIMDKIKAENGKEYYFEQLFAAIFKFIDKERKAFLKKYKIRAKSKDIQWCLVVPSIWNDKSVNRIKNWIVKSALVEMSDQVQIITEADAVSYALQQDLLAMKSAKGTCNPTDEPEESKEGVSASSEGEKYILVDAGGRFTKISCHRIGANNTNTIIYRSRKPFGGCYVMINL